MASTVSEPVEPAVRVARGASYIVLQGVIVNLVGVVYFVFATRLLPTVADFGRITTVNLLILMIVVVGSLGLPTAMTRFIAQYLAKEDQDLARSLYRRIMRLGTFLSLISLVAVFVWSRPLSSFFLGSDYTLLLQLAAIDIFLQLLAVFPLGALQGIYRFREVAIVNIISNVVQFSSAVYLLITTRLGLVGILIGWIIGDGIGTFLALIITSNHFPRPNNEYIRHGGDDLFHFALPLYGTTLVTFASSYVDRFLVLFFAGASALGIYSPVVTTSGILGLFSTGMTAALVPQFSELHIRKGDQGLQQAARIASRYFFIIFLPLSVGLAITAAPTITLFAGDPYSEGSVPLAILSIGLGLTGASTIINSLLLALGRTKVLLVASLVGILADIALAPLISLLSVTGAALGRDALLAGSLLVSWAALGRKWSKRSIDFKAFYEVLMCCIVEAIVVIAIELIWYEKYLLFFYIGMGLVAYLVALRTLGIVNADDIGLLHRFVPSKLRILVSIFGWLMAAHTNATPSPSKIPS